MKIGKLHLEATQLGFKASNYEYGSKDSIGYDALVCDELGHKYPLIVAGSQSYATGWYSLTETYWDSREEYFYAYDIELASAEEYFLRVNFFVNWHVEIRLNYRTVNINPSLGIDKLNKKYQKLIKDQEVPSHCITEVENVFKLCERIK